MKIIKALLIGPLCGLFFCIPAYAQKTKAQLSTEITTTFPDNTSGQITPAGVRAFQSDVITSIMPTAPVVSGNLACFNGTTGLLQDCGIAPPFNNASLATMPAYTIKGNATGASAQPTDISIPALPQKATPAAGDYVMIADSAAGNQLKYALVSAVGTVGSVSSIGGQTGSFTCSGGVACASNVISSTIPHPPYVMPIDYGITCDGTTDWHTQLQTMITASAGKTIFIPAGPSCITSVTLTMPSNTTIIGAGREVSILKGTGTGSLPILSATNQSNISLSHFWLQGSDSATSWSGSPIGAIAIVQNGSAVATGTNYNIQNMKFSNFNATYWNYISTIGSSFFMINVTFSNNVITSVSGDIPTDALNSNNGNYGLVMYSGSGGSNRIENTIIQNNRIDANSLCFSPVLYGNHYKSQITNNLILNPGVTTPDHCFNGGLTTRNSYGILIYDLYGDGNPAANFLVSGNTIINPYSTGVYIVGDGNPAHTASFYNSSGSIISNNLIDGQISQDDATLPRGGIVVNLITDVDVIGNKIRNSFGGIDANGQITGVINIEGNTCTTGAAAGASTPYCYKLGSGSNGSSNTSRHILKGNYGEDVITANGDIIRLVSSTGARFNNVEISDNTIFAGWNGLNAANQFASGLVTIAGNKFGGGGAGTMFNIGSLTGNLALQNNVFSTTAFAPTMATLPAAINGSNIYISNAVSGSSPCAGAGTGSTAFAQNGAWKCF